MEKMKQMMVPHAEPAGAHAEELDKHKIKNKIENSTRHDRHHHQPRITVGLHKVLQSESDNRWNST